MTTKLISLFALCVLLGAAMLACGGAAGNTNTAGNANGNGNGNTKAAATATPAAAGTPAAAASGDKIGVAECDDFIAKYEACVSGKVPASMQATFKSSLDTWRASWKKAAETPQGKATLTTACKSSLEQAKTSLAAFNCSW